MDAVITTADWLAYVDSLGPSDAQSMRMRLESAGAEPQRAEWIVSLVWHRQIARYVARVAVFVLLASVGLSVYQWWLALTGASNAPDLKATFIPAAAIGVSAMALVISGAIELSPSFDLFSLHAIPPELAAPPPRRVIPGDRRSAAWRIPIGFFCLMLIPSALAMPRARNRTWLRKGGVETTGHVARTYTVQGSRGHVSYYVRYDFDHGEGVTSVGRNAFPTFHEGDPIPVTYLPSRPEINLAERKAQLESRSILFDDGGIVVALIYFVFVFPIFGAVLSAASRRERALAEGGVAAIAQITKVSRQAIEYQFGGQLGRFSFKQKLREQPVEGQQFIVLYDPDKPKRSMPVGAMSDIRFS